MLKQKCEIKKNLKSTCREQPSAKRGIFPLYLPLENPVS